MAYITMKDKALKKAIWMLETINDGKRIYETRMIAETIDECEKALLVCNGCDLIYCECGEYDEIMD